MAVKSKVLSGIGKALFTENTIAKNGGLSSLLVPYKMTGTGAVVALGATAAFSGGKQGFAQHNAASMGRITGTSGPARMTNNFTSGGIEAMKRVSGGNYQAFSEMASRTVTPGGIGGKLETYGATPELVSALYGMGGR